MKLKLLALVLVVASACAFVRKSDPIVHPGQPHPYGVFQDGQAQDPYLCGDLVILEWEYNGDESVVLPYPGYILERKINDGEWATRWDYLEQRWTWDWLEGLWEGDWVFYRVKIHKHGMEPIYSSVVGFQYIPH